MSVVVPTLRRNEPLVTTLQYFLQTERYRPLEVIVVDQTDKHDAPTEEYLESVSDIVRIILSDVRSLPKARNIGWRAARGKIVLYVDDDVLPNEDFVRGHVEGYRTRRTWGVTGPVLRPGGELRSKKISWDEWKGVRSSGVQLVDVDTKYLARWAPGCNMSFLREAIARVGGFDENFVGSAVGEDSEFCRRIRSAGGVIRYTGDACLVHRVVPTGGCRSEADELNALRIAVRNHNYFLWKIEQSFARRYWSVGRFVLRECRRLPENRAKGLSPLIHAAFLAVWESVSLIASKRRG